MLMSAPVCSAQGQMYSVRLAYTIVTTPDAGPKTCMYLAHDRAPPPALLMTFHCLSGVTTAFITTAAIAIATDDRQLPPVA